MYAIRSYYVLELLHGPLHELHKRSLSTNSLTDMRHFTDEVKKVADVYQVDALKEYAAGFLEALECFRNNFV